MRPAYMMNSGALLKARAGVAPKSADTAETGAVIDRAGFLSGKLAVQVGEPTGTPDSFSVAAKLQHGDAADGSDMDDLDGAAIEAITEDGGIAEVDVNLNGAKRYVRAVVTPSFTGGTAPAIPVAAQVLLGGNLDG